MDKMLHPLTWSMRALTDQYETVANNVANVSTAGFKRRINSFSQVYAQQMGNINPNDDDISIEHQKPHIDFSQGLMENTGRNLDVAIMGEGFFSIESPDGVQYTRNGTFQIDRQRRLVDSNGRFVAGQDGPIIIPPDTPTGQVGIGDDGIVTASGKAIGKLKLVQFDDQSQLIPVGDSCFIPREGIKPKDNQTATIVQGFLERSNVNHVTELVDLIQLSRMYESNMKMAKSQDERMNSLIRAATS
ncbi:MAG: flagellar basal-body rod protein FlgF [Phycisphaerae bacterium]